MALTTPPREERDRSSARRPPAAIFVAIAIAFVVAAVFHLASALSSDLDGGSPRWRHLLFVAINALVAVEMLLRPAWFVWAFAALCAQQLYSHGAAALRVLRDEGRVDWASLLVVCAMPAITALLIVDLRARRTSRGSAGG